MPSAIERWCRRTLHRGGAGEEIINFTRSILRSKHTLEKIGRGKEEEMEKENGVAGNEHTDRCWATVWRWGAGGHGDDDGVEVVAAMKAKVWRCGSNSCGGNGSRGHLAPAASSRVERPLGRRHVIYQYSTWQLGLRAGLRLCGSFVLLSRSKARHATGCHCGMYVDNWTPSPCQCSIDPRPWHTYASALYSRDI